MEIDEYAMLSEEDIFVSEEFGELTFKPAANDSMKETCLFCQLWSREEGCCIDVYAKCGSWERKDRRSGYFVKQE